MTQMGSKEPCTLLFPIFLSPWTYLLGLHEPVPFPSKIEMGQGISLDVRVPGDSVDRLEPIEIGRLNPTHSLRVSSAEFLEDARKRGYDTSKALLSPMEWDTLGNGLIKQFLLALCLSDCPFMAFPAWRYWVEINPSDWMGSVGIESLQCENLPEEHRSEWNADVFQNWYDKLGPYYCPFKPKENRIAVALHSFWVANSSKRDDQRTTSLMVACEALLSTDKSELTHQISERVAFMLAKKPSRRLEIYKLMKKQYARRSAYVHGAPSDKNHKAPNANASLWNPSATYELFWIVSRLLKLALSGPDFNRALEAKDQSMLSAYLQKLVFGIIEPPEVPKDQLDQLKKTFHWIDFGFE